MKSSILTAVLLLACSTVVTAAEHRIGVGARYWISIEDADVEDVDRSGLAYCASYQYRTDTALRLGLGAELEQLPEDYGASGDHVYTPQVYVVLGRDVYAAVGAGWYFTDGEFSEDPFYTIRVGLDLEVLPKIYIDLHADYRFEDFEQITGDDAEFDSDTVFLGAAIRLGI